MRMCHFWTENGPFAQMRILSENHLISLVLLIRAYLHAKNQSQILIKEIQWILSISSTLSWVFLEQNVRSLEISPKNTA